MPDATVPIYSEAGHGDINPSNGAAQDCGLNILALIFNAEQKSRADTMDQPGRGSFYHHPISITPNLASNSPIQSVYPTAEQRRSETGGDQKYFGAETTQPFAATLSLDTNIQQNGDGTFTQHA
ncbi:MAG: hypothetical protein O2967_07280 [Proteobacteria bacterium]|nr:hypothetical protein [Pseudomonadota bacterium]